MTPDYRGKKWRGAGSSKICCCCCFENVYITPFLWQKWKYVIHLTPTLRHFLFSSTQASTLAQRKLWAARTLTHFIIVVGVGQAWLEIDAREKPFSSTEQGSRIPSFPQDNPHLPTKPKMPMESAFPASFVALLSARWENVLAAEKVPSLSFLIRC